MFFLSYWALKQSATQNDEETYQFTKATNNLPFFMRKITRDQIMYFAMKTHSRVFQESFLSP